MDRRAADLVEAMDDPACDPTLLANTYRHFRTVNAVVSGWRGTYRRVLRPVLRELQNRERPGEPRSIDADRVPGGGSLDMAVGEAGRERPLTLLDIGSGGGDLAIALAGWARRDGIRLEVTGTDPDERAFQAATARKAEAAAAAAAAETAGRDDRGGRDDRAGDGGRAGDGDRAEHSDHARNGDRAANAVRFVKASTSELLDSGARYDVVVSNHVLHHLRHDTGSSSASAAAVVGDSAPSQDELLALLDDSARLARRLAVHSDITRNRLGYVAFSIGMAPFFRDSFIRADGLISIRRSFRPDELREFLPEGWRVDEPSPFRYLLVRDVGTDDPGSDAGATGAQTGAPQQGGPQQGVPESGGPEASNPQPRTQAHDPQPHNGGAARA